MLLTFKSGESVTEYVIGKRAQAFESFYARLKGDPKVYTFIGPLRGKLARGLVHWRKKRNS